MNRCDPPRICETCTYCGQAIVLWWDVVRLADRIFHQRCAKAGERQAFEEALTRRSVAQQAMLRAMAARVDQEANR